MAAQEHSPHETATDSMTDTSDHDSDSFEDANDSAGEESAITSPVEGVRSLTKIRSPSPKADEHESKEEEETSSKGSSSDSSPASSVYNHEKDDDERSEAPSLPAKSPLLTSHRLSDVSLDNVNLDEDASKPAPPPAKDKPVPPPLPSRSSKSSLQGLSGVLPSVPWGAPPPPPPVNTSQTAGAVPPPVTRKITSPFSWLSRNSGQGKGIVTSPPLPASDKPFERRNTVSSINTINSNPELMLSKLEEGSESDGGSRRPGRNSLRDRFKLLRMKEEAGITPIDDEKAGGPVFGGLVRSHTSLGLTLAPVSSADDEAPLSPLPLSPNPALAAGTVVGISAGPSAMTDPDAPVDWDLWQAVVYEGPAAVARTSAEELNKAISAGIPNAIRGVVWQVLAASKNEELELVYRELVARGTDKEKESLRSSVGVATTNGSTSGKESVTASSASSTHSELSPTVTSAITQPPSPPIKEDSAAVAKALAASIAEKKKKAKEDAAALQKLERAIKRDLGARTSYSKYAASAGLQDGLFGLCKAYALFDEGVGYAQGMNFLAMPLLFNMPEEEAFCLLVRLMNQYHLRDLFIQDMPGLHMHLYQFERLLEDFEPALSCHLHRRQVTPHLYATQWFLTLFAYRFPLQLVLRIYDLILSEGLEAILKFGIVLMQKNAATLLGMNDMLALTSFLKDHIFDVYIDQSPSNNSILESGFFGSSGASIDKEVYRADHMIQDACAIKITPNVLKTYRTEWEEKNRAEKEREAELESLKLSNQSLTVKVRNLEERVQDHDSEHAALATELVRTKVINEEMSDENESLKGQVRELRIVVEKQPEEIEEKLKIEMDRLMKRNQEVHEENSKLEEEMAEMEKTLIETKMMYAEVQENHETLTRKWTDLRKALH